MKLSFPQMESFLFGAAETEISEHGLCAYKCTARCRAAWNALSTTLGTRATASTGIRLDFHTDAREITFTLQNGTFDLLKDGQYLRSLPAEKEKDTVFPLALDGNAHRITLIFPSHDVLGRICGLEITDGASAVPHEYKEKFLFLGDSITQGWNSGIDSLSYAWRTSLFFDADCIIHGVGGGYFHPSIFEAPEGFAPDRVFIAFGTNDFGVFSTAEALREKAAAYLELAKNAYEGTKRYVITPIWRYDSWERAMGSFDECIEIIRREAEIRGFTVIDGLSLVPHDKTFFSDAVHPNALGFSLYAQNLIKTIL